MQPNSAEQAKTKTAAPAYTMSLQNPYAERKQKDPTPAKTPPWEELMKATGNNNFSMEMYGT
jgi:hypothetical protein